MAGRHRSTAALPGGEYRRARSLDESGLVVTLWSENGTVEGVFDFSPLPGSVQLRREFAAAFDRTVGPGGRWRSRETCYTGYQAVRVFLRGLAEVDNPPTTAAQIGPAVWSAWRMSLPATSGTRHYLVSLRVLFAQVTELPRPTLELAERRLAAAPASAEAAYTHEEFLRIRSAAATVFNSALVRIRANRERLRRWRAGEYPQDSSDWMIGEALESLTRTGLPPMRTNPHTQVQWVSRPHLRAMGGSGPETTWGRLFPSRAEVFAAAVLLVAAESWNKSVLHEMRVPEAHAPAFADAVEVHTVRLDKPRRPVRLRHTTANLVDTGAGSPGRLLSQVMEVTDPARETLALLGRPTDRLLVYRTACPSRRGQEFGFGIAKSAKVGTESVSLRRLRRTVQVLIRKEPAQNSLQTHENVYVLRDPAGRDETHETITRGLTAAVDHAHTVAGMRVALGADAAAVAELSDQPGLVAAIGRGELDTATAACTDFTHGPYDPPGSSCTASFLLCLACPNAVATRRHLPRLVHLRDALTELHAVVETPVWESQWREHFQRVATLLDAHTTIVEQRQARLDLTESDRATIDRLLRRGLDA